MKTTTEFNLSQPLDSQKQLITDFAKIYQSDNLADLNQLSLTVNLLKSFPEKRNEYPLLIQIYKILDTKNLIQDAEGNTIGYSYIETDSFISAIENDNSIEDAICMAFIAKLDDDTVSSSPTPDFVLLDKFCEMTGITKKAMYNRIYSGKYHKTKVAYKFSGVWMINCKEHDKLIMNNGEIA